MNIMENYKVIRNIADGAFGSVKQAVNKSTGELVAIKKLNKKYYSWEECLELREIKVLRKTVHQNIIKLKEAVRVNDDLYLVFEFCEKNLFTLLKDTPDLEEQRIKEITKDILQGLNELHKNGFFHRDLKPENVLIQRFSAKLADFGLAREIRSQPPYTDYVSTRWYRAPEILLKGRRYNWQVDIFALGCIVAEMFTKVPLFPGANELDQLGRYCSVLGTPNEWADGMRMASAINYRFPNSYGVPLNQVVFNASPEAVDLISIMLTWDPRLRPNAESCLNHPFFHKRNLSNCSIAAEDRSAAIPHSSSSNLLNPGYKPGNSNRNPALRKIGAGMISNNNFRAN
jgi:protein kinase